MPQNIIYYPLYPPPVGAAVIVLALDSTGLTAGISPTLLFSVSVLAAGVYRLVSDVLVTSAGSGNINAQYTYTNGAAAQTLTGRSADLGVNGAEARDSFEFYASASQAINYAIQFTGTGTYALRIRLEYLG